MLLAWGSGLACGGVVRSQIRDSIYQVIMENPGITIIRIADLVGVRHQTVCYHLKKMKRHGHVVAHAKGNRLLHFLNGSVASEEERDLIPVAHDRLAMEILVRIAMNPGIMKKDVAVSTGLTRTGGAWHVNKLTKKGIVREHRVGGHCRLYPVPDRVEIVLSLSRRRSSEAVSRFAGAAPAEPQEAPIVAPFPGLAPDAPTALGADLGGSRPQSVMDAGGGRVAERDAL